MQVYLAGSRHDPWRDPFRFVAPQHLYLDPCDHNHIGQADAYTFLDLDMVRRSDLVVARVAPNSRSMYGASLEIGYAAGLGIPVMLIDELTPADDWRRDYFGMARSVASVVVSSVDEAVAVLAAMPGDFDGASVFNPVRRA